MAYTFQNKRVAYDNIAAGSAAGGERHIAGQSLLTGGGDSTTKPSKDRNGSTSTSVLAVGAYEYLIKIPTTDQNNQEETTLTSNTSHTGFTSGTSPSSNFIEQFGSSNIPGNVS